MLLNEKIIKYAKSLGLGFTVNKTKALTNKTFNILWLTKHKNFYIIKSNYFLKSLKQLQTVCNHIKNVKGSVLFTTVTPQYRGIVSAAGLRAKMPCDENV